jgi:hypothetical protein
MFDHIGFHVQNLAENDFFYPGLTQLTHSSVQQDKVKHIQHNFTAELLQGCDACHHLSGT